MMGQARSSWLRRCAVVLTAVLGLSGIGASAHAAGRAAAGTATPGTTSAPAPGLRSCSALVELVPGTREARIGAITCVSGSVPPVPRTADPCGCPTKLITFWRDLNSAGPSVDLYGRYGPCDLDGYAFADLTSVHDQVGGASAYRMYNTCTISERFSGKGFTGTYSGLIYGQNQPWVGNAWNDRRMMSLSIHASS